MSRNTKVLSVQLEGMVSSTRNVRVTVTNICHNSNSACVAFKLRLAMEFDYFSVEAILAENQKVQCAFKQGIPGMGHIGGGSERDVCPSVCQLGSLSQTPHRSHPRAKYKFQYGLHTLLFIRPSAFRCPENVGLFMTTIVTGQNSTSHPRLDPEYATR